MIELTKREASVLRTIKEYRERNRGLSPSIQEIADKQHISKTRAAQLVTALERKGWITRIKNTARTIALAH